MAIDLYLYRKRRLLNMLSLTLSMLATLFGLLWLTWLLWTLVTHGIQYVNWDLFTHPTPPPGEAGGLSNAITGSLILIALGVAIGAPVGIFAGTYLSEFGRGTRFAAVVRFISDVLLSSPSIILGVFVYEVVVVSMGHFSAYAGGLALALIVLPIVLRTTEDMLRLVPDRMREAAAALGAPRWKVIVSIVYRAARSGILTGILLAVARVSGETAPLLFTALNNQFSSTNLNQPIANLPVVIFQFAMSPYDDWQHLAWAGALLITFGILLLNIIVRVFLPEPERQR
ncbi:Phosphate transport system permease protein PstA (TC 3.A.1.7.1) [hydrothermal vent metagenome]|uniref:Phosphate transport system permease protein PstA (TC 3.A.1.7.1) n=1 Tax=hydrothermal vent metagenome TaxID=652676 RepID=A0A3B1BRW4_9ZZZZ